MKTKSLAEIRAQRPGREEQRSRYRRALELELHKLREELGVSQAALAERMDVSRPRVSAIEKGDEDIRLSTIVRYIEALGGELVISAHIGGAEKRLVGDRRSVVEEPQREAAARKTSRSTAKKATAARTKRTSSR